MDKPQEVQHLVAEFVRLNAKRKIAPLGAVDLARWQWLKKALVEAQQVAA